MLALALAGCAISDRHYVEESQYAHPEPRMVEPPYGILELIASLLQRLARNT